MNQERTNPIVIYEGADKTVEERVDADSGWRRVDIVSRYAREFLLLQRYEEGLLTDPGAQCGGMVSGRGANGVLAEARGRVDLSARAALGVRKGRGLQGEYRARKREDAGASSLAGFVVCAGRGR